MTPGLILIMTILIAESKTMADCEHDFSHEEFEKFRPVGEETADRVMSDILELSVPDLALAVKVSQPMAARIRSMAYEFPHKSKGFRAIEAFTGVVFKALDYSSLSECARDMVNDKVRLISSLYGWLRPDNIIKPYRFDFTTRLAPDDRTFSEYWRKDVTIRLVRDIQDSGDTCVLNLLPADASKCIDWKLVKRFAKVRKVDFKMLNDGGEWKTPHAGLLKALRGELLREIVSRGISNPADLHSLMTDNLTPLGTPDYPDHIAFSI